MQWFERGRGGLCEKVFGFIKTNWRNPLIWFSSRGLQSWERLSRT
jgi:hypothetical protein